MADDIKVAAELRGHHCPHCGGTLVIHRSRAYCDWCETYPKPEPDVEYADIDELVARETERQRLGRRKRNHGR